MTLESPRSGRAIAGEVVAEGGPVEAPAAKSAGASFVPGRRRQRCQTGEVVGLGTGSPARARLLSPWHPGALWFPAAAANLVTIGRRRRDWRRTLLAPLSSTT